MWGMGCMCVSNVPLPPSHALTPHYHNNQRWASPFNSRCKGFQFRDQILPFHLKCSINTFVFKDEWHWQTKNADEFHAERISLKRPVLLADPNVVTCLAVVKFFGLNVLNKEITVCVVAASTPPLSHFSHCPVLSASHMYSLFNGFLISDICYIKILLYILYFTMYFIAFIFICLE